MTILQMISSPFMALAQFFQPATSEPEPHEPKPLIMTPEEQAAWCVANMPQNYNQDYQGAAPYSC